MNAITIVAGLIGFVVGAIVTRLIFSVTKAGVMKIDSTNDDIDRYMLEFDVDLDELKNRNYILLSVDPDADLSHK